MPIDKIVRGLSGNSAVTGALSGAAGGALVSALTGNKSAKKLLKAGGLVAVGGLAWHAYQRYSSSPTEEVPSAQVGITAEPEELPRLERQDFEQVADRSSPTAQLVLKAMIAAAHADGLLEDYERERIWRRALEQGADTRELTALSDEISNPLSIEELAALANTMDKKIEVYAATLLLVDSDYEAGETYLEALAVGLELPRGLVLALNRQAAEAAVAA